MKFLVRRKEGKIECRLLDAQGVVFHFQAPQNTVQVWEMAIKRWRERQPLRWKRLISLKDEFAIYRLEPDKVEAYSEEEFELQQMTYLKILAALSKQTEEVQVESLHASISYALIHNPMFNFYINQEKNAFVVKVVSSRRHGKKSTLSIPIPDERYRDGWWRYWVGALHDWDDGLSTDDMLRNLVINLDLLEILALHWARSLEDAALYLESYAGLLQAIIWFLENVSRRGLIPLRRKIPYLCAALVCNESLDPEEEKSYLEQIFTSTEISPKDKQKLFRDILADLEKDTERNPEYFTRLQTAASAITQYYLERYEFSHAIEVWKQAGEKKDKLLQSVLAFHKHPQVYGMLGIGTLLLSLLPIIFPAQQWLLVLGRLIFLGWAVFIGGGVTIGSLLAWTRLQGKGLYYIELLFPRLLGAIVVGVTILVFESTVWELTLALSWVNWLFLCLISYFGSFVYFYIDVYKSTRLLRLSTDTSGKHFSPSSHSFRMAVHIFGVGLFESLIVTFLATGFLAYAVDAGVVPKTLSFSSNVKLLAYFKPHLGYLLLMRKAFLFVYLPKIVLLWVGLALLIGAFAQLLWQDHQITSI